MTSKKPIIAMIAAIACELTASASATAGPIPILTRAVAEAVPNHATNVYWRGYGPALSLGLAAGALASAAIMGPYYGRGPVYYYGAPAPYPYAQPVYSAPYAYPPAYAGPAYPAYVAPYGYQHGWRGRCYTQEGYGRYRPCSAN